MIHSVRDLSPSQRAAVESLLGHAVAEDSDISIRALPSLIAPEWVGTDDPARQKGLEHQTSAEIDAEITAARAGRRERARQPSA
jgi:hypothetical protein